MLLHCTALTPTILDYTCRVRNQVLQLEPLLRKYWRKNLFLEDEKNAKKDTLSTIDRIDKSISSATFWSTMRIVHALGFQAEYLGRWSESCPCHCEQQELYNWAKSNMPSSGIRPPKFCDRKGCRCPELAAGVALDKVEQMLWNSRNSVMEMMNDVPGDVQHKLHSDWNVARAKIFSELTLKLSTWKHLPHVLCGLAHWDTAIVQKCAQRALALWDNTDNRHSPSRSHAMSKRFLDPAWKGLANDEEPLRPFVFVLHYWVNWVR